MKHLIYHDQLEEDFTLEEEDLAEDLSGVTLYLSKDIHDESMELSINIHGKDGIDDHPITSDIIYDPQVYMGKYFDKPSVCPQCLLHLLFDSKMIALFIERNIKIHWNKDWQSQVIIDPTNLHFTNKLASEDQ